jgi:hypothetical protein
MFMLFLLIRLLFSMFGEVQRTQIQSDRARDARLPGWRPRTREEADQADDDEDALDEAETYERSRQWKKALAIYRELARYSQVPEIVVEAKLGIKRVKRAQGL